MNLRYLLTHEINTFLGTPTTAPLTGIDYICNQLREILIMAACGACLAYLYEIYDVWLRKLPDRKPVFTRIADMIFCFIAGLIILRFWYGSSYCSASIHEGAALIAGTVLGRKVFNFRKSKHLHTIALVYVIILITAYIIIA